MATVLLSEAEQFWFSKHYWFLCLCCRTVPYRLSATAYCSRCFQDLDLRKRHAVVARCTHVTLPLVPLRYTNTRAGGGGGEDQRPGVWPSGSRGFLEIRRVTVQGLSEESFRPVYCKSTLQLIDRTVWWRDYAPVGLCSVTGANSGRAAVCSPLL
jgi:hypothetical protein